MVALVGDFDWIYMRRFRQSRFPSFTISQTFYKLKMSYIPDVSCAIWPYQIVETITQFATCFIAEARDVRVTRQPRSQGPLSTSRRSEKPRMVAAGHVSMHAVKEQGVACKQALRMGYSAIFFLLAWGRARERRACNSAKECAQVLFATCSHVTHFSCAVDKIRNMEHPGTFRNIE